MISIENITRIKKRFPKAWETVKESGEQLYHDKVRIESAKSGLPTLKVSNESGWGYLHSKYDPVAEAERIIENQTGIGANKHVFFYGVGLGYHVEAFVKKFPDVSFSIYEPKVEIFNQYLSVKSFENIDTKFLETVYVVNDPNENKSNLTHFVRSVDKEVLIIVLPSYERVFSEEVKLFTAQFLDTVFLQKMTIQASLDFSKLMTVNSIINLPKVSETANILHIKNKEQIFGGKPAILVAAGPSLDDEIENIRQIKENELAYVFSVGSAINSLLKHGIYPDAAFTYDGSRENKQVFSKIIDEKIPGIPLVYGSTVGFETIQDYPGQMLHFLVSRDPITPYYLSRRDGIANEMIHGYKTISTITLEVLYKLGFNPIVMVGQNFAYGKVRGYASGIDYVGEITDSQLKNSIKIKDVEGNDVLTNPGWKTMKSEMEEVLQSFYNVEVINTTKHGANIEGARYIPLEQVMKEKLTEARIVTDEWLKPEWEEYDYELMHKRMDDISTSIEDLQKIFKTFQDILSEMEQSVKRMNFKQLEKCYIKFDKAFDRLQSNKFYRLFIQPMNGIKFELLMRMFGEVRFETNTTMKANRVMKEFQSYLDCCNDDIQVVVPLLRTMHDQIAPSTHAR
jgi:hypothetical protein